MKIRNAAFEYLKNELDTKEKVKNIVYKKFKLQNYLKSHTFSNYEVEILSKLRSRNIDVKSNFKTKFTKNNMNLECSLENCFEIENQEHLLKCKPLLDKLDKKFDLSNISYQHIFANTKKQKRITEVIVALLDIRNSIMKEQQP